MSTNALAALEQIRQTLGLHHRATPNEIVHEVKRRIIPMPRPAPARVLPEPDDLDIGPRHEKPKPIPPTPRAPIILPSLTKAPVDRLAIIRAAAERGRA